VSNIVTEVDPARTALMRRIRGKNTKPELEVRRALHAAGLRFRLHRRDLPGKPDVVLPRLRVAVFVHGCFWHRHRGCKRCTTPRTREEFWREKFEQNIARDCRNIKDVAAAGWQPVIVWECETDDPAAVVDRIINAKKDQ